MQRPAFHITLGPMAPRWSVTRRLAVLWCLAATIAFAQTVSLPDPALLARMGEYIAMSWQTLTRSTQDLPRALPDPKMPRKPGEPWPLYVARTENRARVEAELRGVLGESAMAQVAIRTLPLDPNTIHDHGLMYLPRPYVVPGGRFNEMYGWDSYFIEVGLLRDGELDRARDMVDNFLYEIRHYGTILNANRTYFLSRSQPPFLTRMVLGVYDKTHDRAWLRGAAADDRALLPILDDRRRMPSRAPGCRATSIVVTGRRRRCSPTKKTPMDRRTTTGCATTTAPTRSPTTTSPSTTTGRTTA